MTLDQWLAAVAETPFTRESNPWSDLVEQAKILALAHLDEPLHISALCRDRKSTRLNSSHEWMSYAVFCLKKTKQPERKLNHMVTSSRRRTLIVAVLLT